MPGTGANDQYVQSMTAIPNFQTYAGIEFIRGSFTSTPYNRNRSFGENIKTFPLPASTYSQAIRDAANNPFKTVTLTDSSTSELFESFTTYHANISSLAK